MSTDYVCEHCFRDKILASKIKKAGTVRTCKFCLKTGHSIRLIDAIPLIAPVFWKYYRPKISNDDIDDIISDLIEINLESAISELTKGNKKAVESIAKLLTQANLVDFSPECNLDKFSESDLYIEDDQQDERFNRIWEKYTKAIKHSSRFFNNEAKELLDLVFSDIDGTFSRAKESPIVKLLSSDNSITLFRGRVALNENEKIKILKNPRGELGAVPSKMAKNGRMNPVGISIFYFAMDEKTCIAELRPPVGSSAITAQFRLTKDIQVFDFSIASKIFNSYSYFDDEYLAKVERSKFFRKIEKRLTAPVMPGDENIDYLPSQVILEYLSTCFDKNIDGIIYPSVQRGKLGRNIALFSQISNEYLKRESKREKPIDIDVDYDYEDEAYSVVLTYKNDPKTNSTITTAATVEIVPDSTRINKVKFIDIQTKETLCHEHVLNRDKYKNAKFKVK
jgi:hypothetical protein